MNKNINPKYVNLDIMSDNRIKTMCQFKNFLFYVKLCL